MLVLLILTIISKDTSERRALAQSHIKARKTSILHRREDSPEAFKANHLVAVYGISGKFGCTFLSYLTCHPGVCISRRRSEAEKERRKRTSTS
ncbi:hypothetical protein Y1Q_0004643 [Alligator mississippiensis]|uniref:Uncharacterized protein n=1 Tax=Alligator mississippiensis TaxID=8496 RepID=A0A151MHR0_ALLMI|nr:hypothetical protein Y1Q_0004643 [Alligator mississippiensis]